MQKITRKEFIAVLSEKTNVLMGCVFRWDDEKCKDAMDSIERIDENAERRTVTSQHANYIVFSNGSRLDFDQEGKKEYFSYQNENGVKFILQRTFRHDDFDDADYQDYIVYAIIEAEAYAERAFRGVDLNDKTEKENLCRWLKANGYYYEASGNFEGYHLEIKCSEKEAEIISGKLEAHREQTEKHEIQRRYNVEKLSFPVDGYEYNVQVLLSIDGGKNFYYCGIGKFCKTEQECQDFIGKYEAEHKAA